MNILQIVPRLETGGVETGTIDLAKKLLCEGHKAVVVSSGGELVKELNSLGVRHYELPVNKKSPFAIFRMIPKLAKIIKRENIDIVHARSRVPAWIAYFASYKTGCNFVTTCHGYYNNHFVSQVMGWGKRVIVPSLSIGRRMIDDFKVPADKVRHIPRGVDLERFKFNPSYLRKRNAFTIGIIGRITPLKGHRYFLRAISKVVRYIPRVKAQVIGDASANKARYKEDLLILIRQLGISSYVEFLGRRSNIAKILSELDVLVMATTTNEAFGRVIIEANAVGVPVIATRVGGIVEVIEDNKDGILVPAKDPEAISKALIRLYKDKELVKDLVNNARKKAEKSFSLEMMTKRILKVYEETLKSLKILVIKLGAAGDAILTIPSFRSLRTKFPQANISVLVDLQLKDVFQNCPYINEVLAYDFKDTNLFGKKLLNIARNLRRESFDILVDLQNNSKSHLLGYLSVCPARYGYRNKKLGFFLNNGIKDIDKPVDPIRHQARVLNMLHVDILDKNLELWPKQEDVKFVNRLLKGEWLAKDQILIGLNVTASRRWQSKKWPIKNFAKLSDELTKNFNARIIVTGSLKDKEEAKKFAELTKSKPVMAAGKTTLMQFAALVDRCKVFITSDSAAMHVAAAMKTPFVALFGPTDPKRHLPPAESYSVIYKGEKCSPCYKPICSSQKCMKNISVSEVMTKVQKWIEVDKS